MFQEFGAIGGTYIQIIAPSTNSQDYYNYKSFHSFHVQAVCDNCGLFLDVECLSVLVLKGNCKILSCQNLTNAFCLAWLLFQITLLVIQPTFWHHFV